VNGIVLSKGKRQGEQMNTQITIEQYEQLLRPLHETRVAQRSGGGGRSLSYLEAWDVKAHLIRIFGFGGWDWEVQESSLAFEEKGEKNWAVAYKVTGRLHIHDLNCTYTEAAIGSAQLPQRGEAHDMAIKTAESDAIKRAAINLGTQFGLSLYNNGSLRDVVVQTLSGPKGETK
jgi:recombination DNA repair RAD52 pathway protein